MARKTQQEKWDDTIAELRRHTKYAKREMHYERVTPEASEIIGRISGNASILMMLATNPQMYSWPTYSDAICHVQRAAQELSDLVHGTGTD